LTPSLFAFRDIKWVYNEEIAKGYLKTKRRIIMNNTYRIRVYDNTSKKVSDSNYDSNNIYKHMIKLAVKWTATVSFDGDRYELNCNNGCKIVVTRLES
jgi:hypothetical protein